MKITKSQLKQLVKEETSKVLNENKNAQEDNPWWVNEMQRVLTEIKNLHDAIRTNNSDDLELFEGYFKQNVSMNFPWINK